MGYKAGNFPVYVPCVSQICERTVALNTRYRAVEVSIENRDISGAFWLIPLRPDCDRVCSRPFGDADLGARFSFIVGIVFRNFCFLAPPSFFDLATVPIQTIHQNCRPQESMRSGQNRYIAFLIYIYTRQNILFGRHWRHCVRICCDVRNHL